MQSPHTLEIKILIARGGGKISGLLLIRRGKTRSKGGYIPRICRGFYHDVRQLSHFRFGRAGCIVQLLHGAFYLTTFALFLTFGLLICRVIP